MGGVKALMALPLKKGLFCGFPKCPNRLIIQYTYIQTYIHTDEPLLRISYKLCLKKTREKERTKKINMKPQFVKELYLHTVTEN